MARNIQISKPSLDDEEWRALRQPLSRGWLTQGPEVAAFEREFANVVNSAHALATTSCTTGLHLILSALDIGPGDEVIVPAFTWIATANAVVYCGAAPVFVDIDEASFNIDVEKVRERLTERTRAVIAVHLFGLCANTDALRATLPDDVHIIEDAACAAGAVLNGRHAGTLGLAAAFSFHPRKSITTGEGGMVTTNDPELAQKIDTLRNHGASVSEEQRHIGSQPYLLPDFDVLGYNYRMTDLQGALGRVQLTKLDRFIAEREKIARSYVDALSELGWLRMPKISHGEGNRHALQAFVTYVDPESSPTSRNEIMLKLHEKGVATRPGTHAIPMLRFYKDQFQLSSHDFPVASRCDVNSMAIPLHNEMSKDDVEWVIECISQVG
jgi:perosamine synthetase